MRLHKKKKETAKKKAVNKVKKVANAINRAANKIAMEVEAAAAKKSQGTIEKARRLAIYKLLRNLRKLFISFFRRPTIKWRLLRKTMLLNS
jgi:DNA topoisomerase VI subunit B